MEITLGQIVISNAGRDKGKTFILFGIIDSSFALIVDGDLRRVEKPKKKRIKHLKLIDGIAEKIHEKIINGEKVTNAEIRKFLALYESENNNVDSE